MFELTLKGNAVRLNIGHVTCVQSANNANGSVSVWIYTAGGHEFSDDIDAATFDRLLRALEEVAEKP